MSLVRALACVAIGYVIGLKRGYYAGWEDRKENCP